MASAYDFSFTTLQGEAYPLAQHRGRPMLIVNTASKCNFTPQYEALQTLSEAMPAVTVIGVPCNDFGGQEPGTDDQIQSFCILSYAITFPMMSKVTTKGPAAHPFFDWVAEERGFMARPRWNFYKYLINRAGELQDFFVSSSNPGSKRFRAAVDRLFYS
jgi:glutathione peroxidase